MPERVYQSYPLNEDEIKQSIDFLKRSDQSTFGFDSKGRPINTALRAHRLEAGKSQAQLAQELGISDIYVSRLERLHCLPSPELAQEIASALETSSEELFPLYLEFFTKHRKTPLYEEREIPESLLEPDLFNAACQRRAEQERWNSLTVDPETVAERHELEEILYKILCSLPSRRDQKIVEMSFGVSYHQEHEYEEIASDLGISPGRVWQLEARALRQLRHPSRARHLRGYEISKKTRPQDEIGMWINGVVNAIYAHDQDRALTVLGKAEELLMKGASQNEQALFMAIKKQFPYQQWTEQKIKSLLKVYTGFFPRYTFNREHVNSLLAKLKEIYIFLDQVLNLAEIDQKSRIQPNGDELTQK